MAASIPASAIVQVLPNVIDAGGSGLDLVGLILTNSNRVPVGTVARFATLNDVQAFFGPISTEATLAATYFAGYDGSTVKPAVLLFSQYPAAPVAAYLRGGSNGLTLAQVQAMSGVLAVTVNGVGTTSGIINLAAATSLSNAAALLQTGIAASNATVTYDSISGSFVIASPTTGPGSTITFASAALAAPLGLTEATGAVLSQGAAAATPGGAMDAVVAQTQDFASFTTAFKPIAADMYAFALWNDLQDNRYLYAMWDNSITPTQFGDTSSVGYLIAQAGLSGTAPIYDPNNGASVAAFLLGAVASINFNAVEGRSTLAFRSGSGLSAGVTNATIAANLRSNGYNFYGAYATANDGFTFFYPGSVSGEFDWIDSYVNQIWMNSGFQLALMNLLIDAGSIPYNTDGYSLIEAAMADVINRAVDFGAIRAGIALSQAQAAQVNGAAGRVISNTLQERGWYALVLPTDASVRAARGSPPVYFFYTDGSSVQRLTVSSVLVQ
jgi:hypothetical protein